MQRMTGETQRGSKADRQTGSEAASLSIRPNIIETQELMHMIKHKYGRGCRSTCTASCTHIAVAYDTYQRQSLAHSYSRKPTRVPPTLPTRVPTPTPAPTPVLVRLLLHSCSYSYSCSDSYSRDYSYALLSCAYYSYF